MEESLFKLVNEEFDIKSVQTERIRLIGGTSTRVDAFVKDVEKKLKEYLGNEERLKWLDLSDRVKVRKIDKISRKVAEHQEQVRLQEEMENSEFSLQGLEILVEMVDDGEIYYIYDDQLGEISEIKYNNLKRLVPQKQFNCLPKSPCKSVYEPFAAEDNFNEIFIGRRPVVRVNTYQHPEWRENLESVDPAEPSPVMPPAAQVFFDHLFPCSESQNYVLDWLYDALTSRQGTEHILVLNGPTGTGKTIFSTQLMIALFREENWGSAPKNLFESTFNSVLKDKRIIFIDEAKINERDYNTVKLYANKKLNIERKGIDANNATDLYYSMILSNNKMGNIFVDPDDRRFSIVETTGKKLLEEFGHDWVDDFVDRLNNDQDFVGAIGRYILSRRDEDFHLNQFKGEKFYQFVWRHLSQWKKIVCNRIFKTGKEGDTEIELDKLVSAIKNDKHIKYDVQPDTITEFIADYRHQGEHLLGNVEEVDDELFVQITPDLITGEREDGDDSEEDLL